MSKNIIIGLILAVIWASSLALFGKHQYDMGVQITESAWNKKENDELKAANAEIVKLQDALAKAEAEKATALAEATKTYQEKEKDAQDQYQKNLLDQRARLLRMYDPGTRSTDAMANMQQVLPPPPTAVMVPRTANFQERLVNFFSVSPQKQTQ